MSVFSGCDIATVTKETWYFFHFFQILQILSFHKLLLLFLAGVHGSKSGSIKVCRRWFVPMQRQYGSHKPSRWRKCFVNTLCLSVRWQCHRGEGWMLGGRSYGWWIEGCMKGQREGRYPSGTLSVLVRQVTLQQLQSTSSWSSYLKAFTAPFLISVTNRFAEEYIDYLPSQPDSCSIWTPLAVHLPVLLCLSQILLWSV